jgi:hypothetical protein
MANNWTEISSNTCFLTDYTDKPANADHSSESDLDHNNINLTCKLNQHSIRFSLHSSKQGMHCNTSNNIHGLGLRATAHRNPWPSHVNFLFYCLRLSGAGTYVAPYLYHAGCVAPTAESFLSLYLAATLLLLHLRAGTVYSDILGLITCTR